MAIMTTRQAAEFDHALERNGWTAEDVKNVSGGNLLASLLLVVHDLAKIVPIKLLELVSTTKLPAVARFVARDAFGENNPDGIKFFLLDGFRNNFLRKVEENVPETKLAIHTLMRPSLDQPIRDELTSELEETTLAHLYELIKRQPKGEGGVLLTNGYANIFYIRDANGKFWAVHAHWSSVLRGWHVGANSVAVPGPWNAGNQVVSQVSSGN